MKKIFEQEIVRLGDDPADAIWTWLVRSGPQGLSFTWGPSRNEPAGYVGIVHLEKIVSEEALAIPDFRGRARRVIRLGLKSHLQEIVVRSIQVAAVVGHQEELEQVRLLVQSDDDATAAHARACIFYMKHK
jgi:hypothetical protein